MLENDSSGMRWNRGCFANDGFVHADRSLNKKSLEEILLPLREAVRLRRLPRYHIACFDPPLKGWDCSKRCVQIDKVQPKEASRYFGWSAFHSYQNRLPAESFAQGA